MIIGSGDWSNQAVFTYVYETTLRRRFSSNAQAFLPTSDKAWPSNQRIAATELMAESDEDMVTHAQVDRVQDKLRPKRYFVSE